MGSKLNRSVGNNATSPNALGELCIATPSICQGKLLVRTATQVYCIGNGER